MKKCIENVTNCNDMIFNFSFDNELYSNTIMQENYNENEFKVKVDKALERVKLILDNTRYSCQIYYYY